MTHLPESELARELWVLVLWSARRSACTRNSDQVGKLDQKQRHVVSMKIPDQIRIDSAVKEDNQQR